MEGGPAAQNSDTQHSNRNPQPCFSFTATKTKCFPWPRPTGGGGISHEGVPVELKVLAGQSHHLGAKWALVFRAIGNIA
jgi:hypothetical protein